MSQKQTPNYFQDVSISRLHLYAPLGAFPGPFQPFQGHTTNQIQVFMLSALLLLF